MSIDSTSVVMGERFSPSHPQAMASYVLSDPVSIGERAREYIGAVALDDRTRRDLIVTIVSGEPGQDPQRRLIRANVFRGARIAERFAGVSDGCIFSLVSSSGAMMIGLLGDGDVSGSFVFADGAAYRFFADVVG